MVPHESKEPVVYPTPLLFGVFERGPEAPDTPLSRAAHHLIELLDGKRTLGQVCIEADVPVAEGAAVAAELLQSGILVRVPNLYPHGLPPPVEKGRVKRWLLLGSVLLVLVLQLAATYWVISWFQATDLV